MHKKYVLILLTCFFTTYLFSQAPAITSFTPVSGKSYTDITITGTNLSQTSAVSFGGTPALFFFVQSATQVRATVGTGSSGAVSVTTPSGTASLNGFTFLPPPSITSFSPVSAGYGTTVNIKGAHFISTSAVFFGTSPALSFTVLSDTTLAAIVGNGGSGYIVVTTNNGQGGKDGFVHTGPVISSFNPTTGGAGTVVTITGTNFSGTTGVSFGAIAASAFTVNSPTSISAVVAATDSLGTISITTPNGTATVSGLNKPFIRSVDSFRGSYGTVVTIKGFNFTGATNVSFGVTSAASYNVLSDTVITAVVGYGSSGSVTVSNAYGTATGPFFYYNYPWPVIDSFTPAEGIAGTVITIKGTAFTGANSVTVSGVPVSSYTVISDTVITAVVPSTTSGNVSVNTPGGRASLPGFTYNGPVISSFYPYSAVAGTKITITGKNLSNATAVTFGGTPAAFFNVVSPDTITAIVGNGSSGVITVTTPLGIASAYSLQMVPLITSFAPASGIIGTIVTITGKDFDPAVTGNIVYFGAVRAKVLSATAAQLVVQVPKGATYQPLSVTVNGLTAYSSKQFNVTFANNALLTTNSFAPQVEYYALYQYSGAYGVIGSYVSDIDGDGAPDMIILKNITFSSNKGFCIFRNKSANGKIDFELPVQLGDYVQNSIGIVAQDIDGDGKPDIAITNGGGGSSVVSVFRNTSTPGNISFAMKTDYAVGSNVGKPEIGDIDGDGKPDIVVTSGNGTSFITVLKNNSVSGSISFSLVAKYPTGSLPYDVAIGDLDGDGKADLATANSGATSTTIFKNSSTIGTISFEPPSEYQVGSAPNTIEIADLDSDGKPEIVASNAGSNTFSVLKNTGGNGVIAFAPNVDYPTGNTPYGFSIADVDGDGKPDVVVANNYNNSVSVYKNISSNGNITLAPNVNYPAGNQPGTVSLADFNADGRPDIVTPNWVSYSASVLENRVGLPVVTEVCPPLGAVNLSSAVTGAVYTWQLNTGNGFVNISDNQNYSGTGTATLHIVDIPSSWYGYQYRCMVDGMANDVFKLKIADTWTGGMSTNWEDAANWSCKSVPDSNTDVIINSGTVTLNLTTTVKSLTIRQGVNFTVANGSTLILKN